MKKKCVSLLIAALTMLSIVSGVFNTPVYATTLTDSGKETPSGLPISQMEKEIDQYVSKYIGQSTPGAAIAVVKDGEIIFSKGYGYADVENQIPVDATNTVFEWGSTSKLFTWTSVMQLVEQGKLDLDADIKTYLPAEFSAKLKYQQPITMRDIMNHAAGFGDYAFNTITFSPDQIVSLEEALLHDQPQQYYKVGTASAYSNYAAALAGYAVECISKQSFSDYEMNHIFNKLAMNNTSGHPTCDDNKKILNSKAQGYLPDGKSGFVHSNWSYVSLIPAGSINGTADDLARFAIALTPGEGQGSPLFLSPDTLNTMLTPSYPLDGSMVGTDHGFWEYAGEYPTLGHGGNTAAFSSQFAIVPEQHFGIVILSNAKSEMNILFGLQDLLIGKKNKEITSPSMPLPSSSEVIGNYVPMEREEGNFLDFSKYLNLSSVTATGTNQISMNFGPFKGNYVQTKPYYYELKDATSTIFTNAFPTLQFKLEQGKVEHIVVGHGMDLSALPPGRTMPFSVVSIILLFSSLLFFIIAPIIGIVMMLKDRKKRFDLQRKYFCLSHLILLLCGTATILNNIICLVRILIINNFRTFSEMKIHILLNYTLLVVTIIATIISLVFLRNVKVSKIHKLIYIITNILLLALFALLIEWNFFSIIA